MMLQAEDEVIELVDLVESDKDEDGTRELTVKSLIKEKAAVKTIKAALLKEAAPLAWRRACLEMKRTLIWICRT